MQHVCPQYPNNPVTMCPSPILCLQGGGQETTLFTAVTQLAHHGMVYVPTGYAAGPGMFDVDVARGGSAWGAGTLAGPTGARQPSEIELLQAVTTVSTNTWIHVTATPSVYILLVEALGSNTSRVHLLLCCILHI